MASTSPLAADSTPEAHTLAARPAQFTYWPPEVLRQVVRKYRGDDWFLLRQASSRLRDEIDQRIARLAPTQLPINFAQRFKGVVSLDLSRFIESDNVHFESFCSDLPCLRELKGLFLSDRCVEYTPEWIGCLNKLSRLEMAGGSGIPREGALLISHCRSLQRLFLYNTGIPRLKIAEMLSNVEETLTYLDIDHQHPIPPSPPTYLAVFFARQLSTLRLRRSSKAVHHWNLSFIDHIFRDYYHPLLFVAGITSLDLSGTDCGNDGVWRLILMTQLTSLNLSNTSVTNVGLRRLQHLTSLRDLRIASTEDSEAQPCWSLPFMSQFPINSVFPFLISLDISGRRPASIVWNLPQWTRLTRLKIRDTDVLIHDVLHNLRQLQDLEATMHPPDPANGSAMRELVVPEIKQLQHLTGGMHIGARHLTRLVLTTPLREVTLGYAGPGAVPLSSTWVEQLAASSSLQELKLEGSFVIPEGSLQPLTQLKALQRLDLGSCELHSPACLLPLERMGLEWLQLPERLCSSHQLPAGLRIGSQRGCFANLSITEVPE